MRYGDTQTVKDKGCLLHSDLSYPKQVYKFKNFKAIDIESIFSRSPFTFAELSKELFTEKYGLALNLIAKNHLNGRFVKEGR